MHVILESDEAWSLMTVLTSQMIDKAGLSSDGKAKLRKWRTDHAEGTLAMEELAAKINEAIGNVLDEKTYRLLRRKGGYIPSH
jgi:hypothetical protein